MYFRFTGHFMITGDAVSLSNYYIPVVFKVISFIFFFLLMGFRFSET